jgi:peptidyl-prolyl cis-trans isomerase C
MNEQESGERSRRPLRNVASMLGFGVLLALIILLTKGPPVGRGDGGRLTFTQADLAQVQAGFERTRSRQPTGPELREAFDRYVRDEVLYREALVLGLDRNDPTVKMSLVRKITMLGTSQARTTEPTDAELIAYYELRAERYRTPASFDLLQIYFSPEKRGAQLETDVVEFLARLQGQEPRPEELGALGDVIMLPPAAEDMDENQLARTFGVAFRDAVMSLAVGNWEGPVESSFGWHLVKILRREESRIPEWTEVRGRIVSDLKYESAGAAEEQFYAEILPRHQVVFSKGLNAALEGDDR